MQIERKYGDLDNLKNDQLIAIIKDYKKQLNGQKKTNLELIDSLEHNCDKQREEQKTATKNFEAKL